MLEILGDVGSCLGCQGAPPSCPISVGSSTPCFGILGLLSPGPAARSPGHSWLSQLAMSISIIVPCPAQRWQLCDTRGGGGGHRGLEVGTSSHRTSSSRDQAWTQGQGWHQGRRGTLRC